MTQIQNATDLAELLQDLHDSEISGSITWLFDNAWHAEVGCPPMWVLGSAYGDRAPLVAAMRQGQPSVPLAFGNAGLPRGCPTAGVRRATCRHLEATITRR